MKVCDICLQEEMRIKKAEDYCSLCNKDVCEEHLVIVEGKKYCPNCSEEKWIKLGTKERNIVLRFFLEKLPKDELIDSLLTVVNSLTEGDEKFYQEISHDIITLIQAREILEGKNSLEGYSEPHKTELAEMTKKLKGS